MSVAAMATQAASVGDAGIAGRAVTARRTSGEAAIAQHSACSRPPEPTTSTLKPQPLPPGPIPGVFP